MNRQEALEILKHNQNFPNPENWADFAISKNFSKVQSIKLSACPICGHPNSKILGSYVYYSTLHNLCQCSGCQMIYADMHISEAVVKQHFDSAYKDKEYFTSRRKPVFNWLVNYLSSELPVNSSVLDLGGATGEALLLLQHRRPDLELHLADISERACSEVRKINPNIYTYCLTMGEISKIGRKFDCVLALDVIYYERNIACGLDGLCNSVNDGGLLLIRIPNKLLYIRVAGILQRLCYRVFQKPRVKSRLFMFNPEHLYIFSKTVLTKLITKHGFSNLTWSPSPALTSKNKIKDCLLRFYYLLSVSINRICGWQITPSVFFIARKQQKQRIL